MRKLNKNQQKEINFTRKQFLALLKLVYLGNWMANACRVNGKKKEYREMENYILSFARQFGLGEYIDEDEAEKGEFYLNGKFEEETDVRQLCEEYDEEVFWQEVSERLGERDFFRHYSEKEIKKMTRKERFTKLYEFIDKWGDEINKHGIERSEIRK